MGFIFSGVCFSFAIWVTSVLMRKGGEGGRVRGKKSHEIGNAVWLSLGKNDFAMRTTSFCLGKLKKININPMLASF